MAISIAYTVTDTDILPRSAQKGGVQGDHNAYQLVFTISNGLTKENTTWRLDVIDGLGQYYSSSDFTLIGNTLTYLIPSDITNAGGTAQFHLVHVSLNEQNEEDEILHSFPARVYFESNDGAGKDEYRRGISGLYAETKALKEAVEADQASTARSAALAAEYAFTAASASESAKQSVASAAKFSRDAQANATDAIEAKNAAASSAASADEAKQAVFDAVTAAEGAEFAAAQSASQAGQSKDSAASSAEAAESAKNAIMDLILPRGKQSRITKINQLSLSFYGDTSSDLAEVFQLTAKMDVDYITNKINYVDTEYRAASGSGTYYVSMAVDGSGYVLTTTKYPPFAENMVDGKRYVSVLKLNAIYDDSMLVWKKSSVQYLSNEELYSYYDDLAEEVYMLRKAIANMCIAMLDASSENSNDFTNVAVQALQILSDDGQPFPPAF